MKKNCVVFGGTSDQVFAVACVMMDLKARCPGWVDEVVYFHDGIAKKQQNLLGKILPCRCVKYEPPFRDSIGFDQATISYFSKMVFTKYECLRLLDEYENVIWLDYDLVVLDNICELSEYCESGIKMMPTGSPVRIQLHRDVAEYDMTAMAMSAGTFVFQRHIKNNSAMYRFCYDKTLQYAAHLRYPEQAIFDFMIQEFNLRVCEMDPAVYAPHPNECYDVNKAKILHAYGQPKFWNGIQNTQWQANYSRWVAMGGAKYVAPGFFHRLRKQLARLKSRCVR